MSGDSVVITQKEGMGMEGDAGFWQVEARGLAKYPAMHRTTPGCSIIQLRWSILMKLRNPDIYSVADKYDVLEPEPKSVFRFWVFPSLNENFEMCSLISKIYNKSTHL